MRAREPDQTGFAVVDGVRTYYEVSGDGPTTLLMMATFPVVDGRQWKPKCPIWQGISRRDLGSAR